MTTTTAQKIAQLEAQLARLREKDRALETGQKIILGGMLLASARTDQHMRQWVITEAAKVTRPADIKRLAPLIEELKTMSPAPQQVSSASAQETLQVASPKQQVVSASAQETLQLGATTVGERVEQDRSWGALGTPKIGG